MLIIPLRIFSSSVNFSMIDLRFLEPVVKECLPEALVMVFLKLEENFQRSLSQINFNFSLGCKPAIKFRTVFRFGSFFVFSLLSFLFAPRLPSFYFVFFLSFGTS